MSNAMRWLLAATMILTAGLMTLWATVSNYSVTPSSVTFTSSNPGGSVTGSATATVRFRTTLNPTFSVYAKATGTNFTCSGTVPISSITLTCSGASGVTCQSGSLVLTNSGNGTLVATGSGNHNPAQFVVTYTFTDAWNYQVGTSCTATVNYIYIQ